MSTPEAAVTSPVSAAVFVLFASASLWEFDVLLVSDQLQDCTCMLFQLVSCFHNYCAGVSNLLQFCG